MSQPIRGWVYFHQFLSMNQHVSRFILYKWSVLFLFYFFKKKSVMTDLKNFCPTLVCGTSYNVSMFLHSYTHILNHFRLRKCCAWYIIFNGIKMDVINQPHVVVVVVVVDTNVWLNRFFLQKKILCTLYYFNRTIWSNVMQLRLTLWRVTRLSYSIKIDAIKNYVYSTLFKLPFLFNQKKLSQL